MAVVVLLRGVNVGGHRVFKPSQLVTQLKHLGVVNIGAAGTLVIREKASEAQIRAELARCLPFQAHVALCPGAQLLRMVASDPFAGEPVRPDMVRFVTVLSARPKSAPKLPVSFPPEGQWLVKVLGRQDRFVFGVYRRHMKTIRYLGAADKLFDVPVTTRNWNTITAIAKVLSGPPKAG